MGKDILSVADSLDKCIEVVEEHLNDTSTSDNVDQNIKSVIDGVKITQSTLLDTFERHGIVKIKSMHEEFDTDYHEDNLPWTFLFSLFITYISYFPVPQTKDPM